MPSGFANEAKRRVLQGRKIENEKAVKEVIKKIDNGSFSRQKQRTHTFSFDFDSIRTSFYKDI